MLRQLRSLATANAIALAHSAGSLLPIRARVLRPRPVGTGEYPVHTAVWHDAQPATALR
jgi:hypothetical protein